MVRHRYMTPKGRLIGWKKAYTRTGYPVLVKLSIPADAKAYGAYASSARDKKAKRRASKAKVLGIWGIISKRKYDSAYSGFASLVYRVGKTVRPIWFDGDHTECGGGIHFFLDKKSAIEY